MKIFSKCPFEDNDRIQAGFSIRWYHKIEVGELSLDSLFIAAVAGELLVFLLAGGFGVAHNQDTPSSLPVSRALEVVRSVV